MSAGRLPTIAAAPTGRTPSRWLGRCYGCHRERELQSRYEHAAKVLCDDCAARPARTPTATGNAQRGETAGSRRHDAAHVAVFDRPLDRLLLLLRELGADAYRCCPQPGQWQARCPLCGDRDAVDIFERGYGGPVTITARCACAPAAILDHVQNPKPPDDGWRHVDELLDLAGRQQQLIHRLVHTEDDTGLELAA